MQLLSYFPLFATLKTYNKTVLGHDAIAAIIVAIMLIPQALAYSLLAGLPPEMGLYASILPLVLYALLGSSHVMSVGPIAVVSLMVASALGQASRTYGIDYLTGAMTLAFLSGVFMLTLGLLRFGVIAKFLSQSVIAGFMSAAAILIALSQAKHILGISASGKTVIELLSSLGAHFANTNVLTLTIGIGGLLFLAWARKRLKTLLEKCRLPNVLILPLVKASPVILVAITIALAAFFSLQSHGVALVGDIPKGLPKLALPNLQLDYIKVLLFPAALISLIGYISTISVGKALATRSHKHIDSNQELIALGASNIGAAIAGGFPITGGFARTVVNYDAGAETQVAGVLTAVALLFAVFFLTPILYFLPTATLAATIIISVLSMVDLKPFRYAWTHDKADFIVIALTFSLTLLLGVEIGLFSGIITSLFVNYRKNH